jgi:hypothetical protein
MRYGDLYIGGAGHGQAFVRCNLHPILNGYTERFNQLLVQ